MRNLGVVSTIAVVSGFSCVGMYCSEGLVITVNIAVTAAMPMMYAAFSLLRMGLEFD